MILDKQQTDKVKRNRKPTLPKYYNANTKTDTVISLDFEAFLILLADKQKDDLVVQLQNTKKDSNKRKDRDEMLGIAIQLEQADAASCYQDVYADVKQFTEFKSSFKLENFSDVLEVGQLMDALQFSLGEPLLTSDRLQHLETFTLTVSKDFNNGKISDDRKKELDSWISVVGQYKGTS